MENKSLKKSTSTCLQVEHGQAQRGLPPRNYREPFYIKEDEYLLSGDRLQREQAGSSRACPTLTLGRGVSGYTWFSLELSWKGEA